ncbi:MAG: endonuclease [Paracoccaceae bacterium]|nr:endonuclease [Paracoccaceae bacterium]
MRIATYNVEWFNNLFDDDGNLLEDDGPSGREGVSRAEQLTALGIVFTAMNADAVLVVEAPDTNGRRSTVNALENFAAKYGLRARRALAGFPNETQQEIALLYDPDLARARHDPIGPPTGKKGLFGAPRFDGVFRLESSEKDLPKTVSFSKPPLEVSFEMKNGHVIRLMGVHVKSKAPIGARSKAEIISTSIDNRRKQLAQCIWIRQRIEEHLDAGESMIVLGDLNDGPGLDEYEKLFGQSCVELILGDGEGKRLYDPHARMALSQRVGAVPVTSRFFLAEQDRYIQALLDYVLLSRDLMRFGPRWRIWHPFDDSQCYQIEELREALLTASDHFPVSVDLDLSP